MNGYCFSGFMASPYSLVYEMSSGELNRQYINNIGFLLRVRKLKTHKLSYAVQHYRQPIFLRLWIDWFLALIGIKVPCVCPFCLGPSWEVREER